MTALVCALALAAVAWRLHVMSQAFDRLSAECASCVALMGQAVTTINALAAKVAAAPDAANVVDPAAVDAVTAQLQAAASSLSSAVAAQTPPAPTA